MQRSPHPVIVREGWPFLAASLGPDVDLPSLAKPRVPVAGKVCAAGTIVAELARD